jgi:glycerol-3-phosphate dehydrogenase (NAD(P)+)
MRLQQNQFKHIAIIGAGSFGTAMARSLSSTGHKVSIWAREPEIVASINTQHRNINYLSDIQLPLNVKAFISIEETIKEADLIVLAVPSHVFRSVCVQIKPFLLERQYIVSLTKGIENDTYLTMSQVVADVTESVFPDEHIGVLSGPSHAEEIAKDMPTTAVASAYSKKAGIIIQEVFHSPTLRIYLNQDIVGVEVGGAVKNIMAIASGIIEGAEMGDNAKAALITRGLHEMKRLGMRLGAFQETFSGLTGIGDLVVTCCSSHSRNRSVGYRIGKGEKLDQIIASTNMVAEGVKTTKSVHGLAKLKGVEMPITDAVYAILFENMEPEKALTQLMTRLPKDEILI